MAMQIQATQNHFYKLWEVALKTILTVFIALCLVKIWNLVAVSGGFKEIAFSTVVIFLCSLSLVLSLLFEKFNPTSSIFRAGVIGLFYVYAVQFDQMSFAMPQYFGN
jgi:hypothetical protein